MPAKRSPTLPPPPADGAALHARYAAAVTLKIAIPGPLVARLQQLALADNRSLKQEAEWLLWQTIRHTPTGHEAPPPDVPPTPWPDPEETP